MRDAGVTARTLADELGDGRQAEVVAESPYADAHSVEAVAVLEPRAAAVRSDGLRQCRILLVRSRTDPDHWSIDQDNWLPDLPPAPTGPWS